MIQGQDLDQAVDTRSIKQKGVARDHQSAPRRDQAKEESVLTQEKESIIEAVIEVEAEIAEIETEIEEIEIGIEKEATPKTKRRLKNPPNPPKIKEEDSSLTVLQRICKFLKVPLIFQNSESLIFKPSEKNTLLSKIWILQN